MVDYVSVSGTHPHTPQSAELRLFSAQPSRMVALPAAGRLPMLPAQLATLVILFAQRLLVLPRSLPAEKAAHSGRRRGACGACSLEDLHGGRAHREDGCLEAGAAVRAQQLVEALQFALPRRAVAQRVEPQRAHLGRVSHRRRRRVARHAAPAPAAPAAADTRRVARLLSGCLPFPLVVDELRVHRVHVPRRCGGRRVNHPARRPLGRLVLGEADGPEDG
mmetsp:Transcript_22439/g.71773  ORF Transcript_22439/g.71773 Transcript_22439/m.71773 type:complete len:220 (-) Transcript_22439:432-1091(-)